MSTRLKIIFCIFALIVGVLILSKSIKLNRNLGPKGEVSTPTPLVQVTATPSDGTMTYTNTEYGFSFRLPASWRGYSIVETKWEGYLVDSVSESPLPDKSGTIISIRHPLWTKDKPRQDIPIMIFDYLDWDLISKEKLSVSAAPIGPKKLGQNKNYVFALPARYNYAYPDGYEEVEQLIGDGSLSTF